MPADFETIAQRALLDLNEVGVSTNLDRVKLALIDSCVHHETEVFPFMELRFELKTIAGKDAYGPDDGVPAELAWVPEDLWIDIEGSAENRHRLRRRTPDAVEEYREGGAYSNWPLWWSFWAGKFEFWPTPDLSTHVIRFRGYIRPPHPEYRWDSGSLAWQFFGPMTSPWFEPPQEPLIRTYAEWLVLNKAERDEWGQSFLGNYAEARSNLIQRTEQAHTGDTVEPYPVSIVGGFYW